MMNKMNRFLIALSLIVLAFQTAMAAAPRNYYSSALGKNDEQLMASMRSIIRDHKQLSYAALWDAFKTTDTDANGYIIDMYSNCTYRTDQHGGNGQNVGDGFNREHSFPKSWFDDASPMYTDLFHLYPTDIKVNNQRSNYPFGECEGGERLAYKNWYGKGRLGSSTFTGYSGTVFEPDDEYKGDFARTYFYMVTCYKNELPNWPGSPQLDYRTNKYKAFSTWSINLLVKWARLDPVSEKETKRNDAVYTIQGNRNPFIDNPELFEYIWGNKQGQPWYGGDDPAPDPVITLPANGAVIPMGTTVVGTELTCTVTFKGEGLSSGFRLSMSDNDNFYVNANSFSASDVNQGTSFTVTFMAQQEGEFENRITLSSSEVSTTFTVTATATLKAPDPGDCIIEDWEGCEGYASYADKDVQGHAFTWQFLNAGVFSDDVLRRDKYSCRMGKDSNSSLTMTQDVEGGVSAFSFWAGTFGNDSNAQLLIEYSTDKGSSWNSVGSVMTTQGGLSRYDMIVDVDAPVRFRIAQMSGSRANIDDIAIYKKAETYLVGDVNLDKAVNVADVNAVIAVIMGGHAADDLKQRADVNGDKSINIADINAIIGIIMAQ